MPNLSTESAGLLQEKLQQAIQLAIKTEIEAEVEEAKKRIEKRIRAESGAIAANVLSFFDMYYDNGKLTIRVEFGEK